MKCGHVDAALVRAPPVSVSIGHGHAGTCPYFKKWRGKGRRELKNDKQKIGNAVLTIRKALAKTTN